MMLVPPLLSETSKGQDAGHLARIAIIGRGFTGMMTAIAVLKGLDRPFHLVMFDPEPKVDLSKGVNQSSAPVLNSRVRDLSLNPAAQDDFQRWIENEDALRERLVPGAAGVEDAFVPGDVFNAYVYQRFSEALSRRTDVVFQISAEKVAAIEPHPFGLSVVFGDQQRQLFDSVFLATGYGLRDTQCETSSDKRVENAVVIGGGVHAVDRALRLLENGEASHVTLISASGFLPQSHTRTAVGPTNLDQPLPNTLRGAFRFLREAANSAASEGSGWQGIMNGFRLRARDLWRGLTPEERSRFKRHVKSIYDSHRNRLPPEHYDRLHAAIAKGSIAVKKGKVERVATNGVLLSGPSGLEVLVAERVISCRFRPNDLNSPLFRSVWEAGLASRDEVDLGVLVDSCGRAMTASNEFHGVFAMGPLGLGSLPDIDLVPQIVVQSHAAAARLGAWIDEVIQARKTGNIR